jgi:hypothetical protein
MAEEHQLKQIGRRAGAFDGRIMLGMQFEDERGIRGWHITTWTVEGTSHIDDYWIENGKFYEMLRRDISGYPGVPSRIETGRLVVEIEAKKRDTILKGLAQWELEAIDTSHRE